jgi:hypothetical protein
MGSTALHRAVSMNHTEAVEELIKRGADIHAQNRMGNFLSFGFVFFCFALFVFVVFHFG